MEQSEGTGGLLNGADAGDGSPDSLVVGLWASDDGHSGRDVEILHCMMDRTFTVPRKADRVHNIIYQVLLQTCWSGLLSPSLSTSLPFSEFCTQAKP